MMPTELEQIETLFRTLLNRAPGAEEATRWTARLAQSGSFYAVFAAMLTKPEFLEKTRVKSDWPIGHFYSPIVDPGTVVDYVGAAKKAGAAGIAGIDFHLDRMLEFWKQNTAFIARAPFKKLPVDHLRFFWSESPYPIGDAATYRAILNHVRPSKIIEIGSGFSTACALDTLDEIGAAATSITCIEPYPAALRRRLRPGDLGRITLLESGVQQVDPTPFEGLGKGDILFIDSTHVLKTGSDVHFELFTILPRLRPGVLVHFHDIRWPFEYPDPFIFERNYSWNEAYALRALLMYSARFSVFFYSSLFAERHRSLVRETFPDFLINPGSSIWLQVNDAQS
jgi:hypothetical protein